MQLVHTQVAPFVFHSSTVLLRKAICSNLEILVNIIIIIFSLKLLIVFEVGVFLLFSEVRILFYPFLKVVAIIRKY